MTGHPNRGEDDAKPEQRMRGTELAQQMLRQSAILFSRVVRIDASGAAIAERLDYQRKCFTIGPATVDRLQLRVGDFVESPDGARGVRRADTRCQRERAAA